jgi:hypothetical protein
MVFRSILHLFDKEEERKEEVISKVAPTTFYLFPGPIVIKR